MEVSNRFSAINQKKIPQKNFKKSFEISHTSNSPSAANAQESLAKAKIALDNIDNLPLAYEEKIELLNSKGVREEQDEIVKLSDKSFKEFLAYLDEGINPQDIKKYLTGYKSSDKEGKILDFLKHGVPLYYVSYLSNHKIADEKLETLKEVDFIYDEDLKNFKVNTLNILDLLRDDEKYEYFLELIKKGVKANIALYCANNQERANDALNFDIDLSNNEKCAYALLYIDEEEVKKIAELCKKFNLDIKDYNSWNNLLRSQNLEDIEKSLELNVPFEELDNVRYAQEEDIKNAHEIKEKYDLPFNIALQLLRCKEDELSETVEYFKKGLNLNNANVLAGFDIKKEQKEEILNLVLDKTFNLVVDAKGFITLDIEQNQKQKALSLIKLGACLPFALFCAQNQSCYLKALDIIKNGYSEDLGELYLNREEDLDDYIELMKLGVKKEDISWGLYSLTPEKKELLRQKVPFEAIKDIKEDELEKITKSDVIKNLLIKKISLKDAEELACVAYEHDIDINSVMKFASDLPIEKILFLAKQDDKDNPIKKEDSEIVLKFANKANELDKTLKLAYDFGFLNQKALQNFEEFEKRINVKNTNYNDILNLSQLDFKNSREIDRAAELYKNKVSVEYIPFFISDDKAFLNCVNDDKYKSSRNSYVENYYFYMINFVKNGLNLADIENIAKQYWKEDSIGFLQEYLEKGHTLQSAIDIAQYKDYKHSICLDWEDDAQEKREKISDLVLKGCNFEYAKEMVQDNKNALERFDELLKEGYAPNVAEKIVVLDIKLEDKNTIEKIEKLQDPKLVEDLKKKYPNPQMGEFIEKMYDFSAIDKIEFKKIIDSDISFEDIKKSAEIFIKSPLKQAMKKPNLYLSGIPIEDTEKVDGKYPTLTQEKIKKYQNKLIKFFQNNTVEITRLLKYIDADTFNQMMDKRTVIFGEQLSLLNTMDDKHFELAKKIINCRKDDGKLLSAKEKIDLIKMILYHQLGYLDTAYLEEMIKESSVNVESLREKIFEKLMETIGIDPKDIKNIPKEKLELDNDYMYLLLRTQQSTDFNYFKHMSASEEERLDNIEYFETLLDGSYEEIIHQGYTKEKIVAMIDLLKRAPKMSEKDVYKEFCQISPFTKVDFTAQNIAKIAILDDFNDYISNRDNEFSKTNQKTKEQFKKNALNYDSWLNYDEIQKFDLNNSTYNISLWERCPQKDLFMGNRTSCCTAIVDGGNKDATQVYLTSTAFNVVELKDENGNILGMSRIFMGKEENNPCLVIENIELNNAFLKGKTPDELQIIRDNMFSYIKKFAQKLSDDKELKIYFSSNYTHVPHEDLNKIVKNIDFIGDITNKDVYLNSYPGWINPKELKNNNLNFYEIQ